MRESQVVSAEEYPLANPQWNESMGKFLVDDRFQSELLERLLLIVAGS
jgi:hypothetical protein